MAQTLRRDRTRRADVLEPGLAEWAAFSALVEQMRPLGLTFYAGICGWTLARAHARSRDPVAIAAYLGTSDAFDQSIAGFSERYADQNERDYQAFVTAIRSGRLEAVEGV